MRDPMTCPYGTYVLSVDRTLCSYGDREFYTNCHRSVAGEPPACAFDEADNSDEAVMRRRKWMMAHGGRTG